MYWCGQIHNENPFPLYWFRQSQRFRQNGILLGFGVISGNAMGGWREERMSKWGTGWKGEGQTQGRIRGISETLEAMKASWALPGTLTLHLLLPTLSMSLHSKSLSHFRRFLWQLLCSNNLLRWRELAVAQSYCSSPFISHQKLECTSTYHKALKNSLMKSSKCLDKGKLCIQLITHVYTLMSVGIPLWVMLMSSQRRQKDFLWTSPSWQLWPHWHHPVSCSILLHTCSFLPEGT